MADSAFQNNVIIQPTTRSGVKAVTSAGTAVALGLSTVAVNGPLMVKALTTNTGLIYIGYVSADVESTNGLSLAAGDVVIFNFVRELSQIYIDSAVNGEGVAWLMLNA